MEAKELIKMHFQEGKMNGIHTVEDVDTGDKLSFFDYLIFKLFYLDKIKKQIRKKTR